MIKSYKFPLKKISMIFMSLWITFLSIFLPYIEVKALDIPTAFWGVMESGRALFTALNTGGGLKNGVNFDRLRHISIENMQEFQVKAFEGYVLFCVYKERLKIQLEHPEWSSAEVSEHARVTGQSIANNFKSNALEVQNTTGSITLKDWGYWQEYCDTLSNIAQNGLGSGSIDPNSIIRPRFGNPLNLPLNAEPLTNIGSNTFLFDDHYYINSGTYYGFNTGISNVPTDRVRIPFIVGYTYNGSSGIISGTYYNFEFIDVNRLTKEVIYSPSLTEIKSYLGTKDAYIELFENFIRGCNFPMIFVRDIEENRSIVMNWFNDYANNLDVAMEFASAEDYEEYLKNMLDQTEVGKSIEEGGTDKKTLVPVGSVPVKKSGVKVGEETATGVIGWDIPDTQTVAGALSDPRTENEEVKATGIVAVPEEKVIGATEDSTVITWDKDEPISVPETDDPTITVPITDVISIQGGEYYPAQIDITGFFPFCIPFDIIYLVENFTKVEGKAPVITIPIMYPDALENSLGTDRYDVVIDFNDYVTLRNIIRVFLLIGFIIGLMKITRDIIRG